ncbi:MAG: endonuclease III domain-containing protein [Gammaproteobacteria bacterium]|nr:endonuclease III domain-containing protein [Gammaproteobacteria bacterium]NIR96550.1 endonuclease III domain-containing protein [Gammaproteobacteria bacterium]NIT62288.1 endonuclease III domain-containing protein [Gammaproteobacteria bacterium]NIV19192.1 endonuclease [Gammaproteobacteria bacterium]NIX10060.1 endonuclease [Gammaproteobacteria bacterium]
MPARRLRSVYQRLYRSYGGQDWWPGETPFEIMVGAVLTQNTAWSNVERAIANLKAERFLDPRRIARLPHGRLARLIKPSGYFNIKAKRLRNFCRWYLEQGGYDELSRCDTETLRHGLLSVNGVGHETADDMLLYAFERPVFVIDAYTRRIFSRLGMVRGDELYDALRLGIEHALGADTVLFNEYHALIVCHGKDICKKVPRCAGCSLKRMCRAESQKK